MQEGGGVLCKHNRGYSVGEIFIARDDTTKNENSEFDLEGQDLMATFTFSKCLVLT